MFKSSRTLPSIVLSGTILALGACGGGGGENEGAASDAQQSVPYPDSLIYSANVSSMYTLKNDVSCSALDPYCRVVANKDAVLDIEVDATVSSVVLQVSTEATNAMQAPSVANECNAQCWQEALGAGNATIHLQGKNLGASGKNVFQVRVPSYLNNPTATWLVSLQTNTQTYNPKAIARAYFESDAIELVVVPMRINGVAPKNLPTVFQIANDVATRVPLPIASVRIGDTVDITEGVAMDTNDDYTAALRNFAKAVQASAGKTYWYGMFSASVRKEGSVAGMGYQPGYAAIGWDHPDQWAQAMTHELGHNLSLAHTECGNPAHFDAQYPYAQGSLFALAPAKPRYAFDLNTGVLRMDQKKDVMGYCAGQFFSDYSITKIWSYVQPNTGRAQRASVASSALPAAYTAMELQQYWDSNPPVLQTPTNEMGHIYVWSSGTSNTPHLRALTSAQETPLLGASIEVLHPDSLWHKGVAYRVGHSPSLEVWTPGPGQPQALRLPAQR